MKLKLAILLITISCVNQGKTTENVRTLDQEDYNPPELNLNDLTINGNKVLMSKETLLKDFGEPDKTYSGGAFQPEKYQKSNKASKETLINYESYLYKSLKFAVWNDKAQIQFIDFKDSPISVQHNQIEFSGKTSLDEIKEKYPYAYENKNYSLNSMFGFDPEDTYGFKKEDCTWIQFKNGINESYWKIELTFLKGKLIWAYFDVGE